MPQDLSEIPSEELMNELQRRLTCTIKPEKHVILVGGWDGRVVVIWVL